MIILANLIVGGFGILYVTAFIVALCLWWRKILPMLIIYSTSIGILSWAIIYMKNYYG